MTLCKLSILAFCIVSLNATLYPQSFIKPKTPSSTKLKETCGQQAGVILKEIPKLMCAIADVQNNAVDFLEDLLEGDSQGFCSTASRTQLENRSQKMAAFNKKMVEWEAEMRSFARELNQES